MPALAWEALDFIVLNRTNGCICFGVHILNLKVQLESTLSQLFIIEVNNFYDGYELNFPLFLRSTSITK